MNVAYRLKWLLRVQAVSLVCMVKLYKSMYPGEVRLCQVSVSDISGVRVKL